MAEQTMSKADVLAICAHMDECLDTAEEPHRECLANIRAIAAWLAAACVVEGGHQWEWRARYSNYSPVRGEGQSCAHCGRRRAAEGG